MTKDDIIRMALEAELIYDEECTSPWIEETNLTPFLERFAALVASAERDRMCEQFNLSKELAHEKAKSNEAN